MYFLEVCDYCTRENNDERELLKLLYQSLRALTAKSLEHELVRYIFEIKTVVINGEFPGIPAGEKLLDSTVYAISFIAGSPVEKLYTFTVTPPVLRELGRLAGLYCKNALDGHFKSLEIIIRERSDIMLKICQGTEVRKMKKISLFLLAVCGIALLMAGCSSKETEEDVSTLELKKNGEIVHTIVEDFGESYYDLDELKSSTEEMIADYNSSAGADRVKLNSAQTQDGVVRLVMTFKSSEDYSGFYRQALFSGTVKEAFGAGYDLDVTLNSVKEEGTTISKQDILDMGDKHVAIVRENINIRPYGDILYMSSDVTLGADGKTAVVTNGESLSYIIFK